MRSILVTGGTGMMGEPIADELRKNGWAVFVLQRNPHNVSDSERWLDYDLMEPEQIVTAVHQLWNEVSEKKIPPLSAIVHAAGANGYGTWDTLTVFEMQAAMMLHVIEPLILTKYLIDFGVMAKKSTAVWLLDPRSTRRDTVPQRMAKAGMVPMVQVFSTQLPDEFTNKFIPCPAASDLGATRGVAKTIIRILE